MKQSKATTYEQYGIKYDAKRQKVYHDVLGWINPLLINGNDKLGRGVYTYSMLPTNKMYIVSFGPFTSGVKGVYWSKREQRWIAKIGLKGKTITIGRFQNLKDAEKARKQAEEQYYSPIIEQWKKDHSAE